MMGFIFISDKSLIDKLLNTMPQQEIRQNMLQISKGEFSKEDGYLVNEKWLVKNGEFGPVLENMQSRNEFDTGDPSISYDDLCKYQKEFEEKHGVCDGFCLDSDVIAYQLELARYCTDRAHGMLCG